MWLGHWQLHASRLQANSGNVRTMGGQDEVEAGAVEPCCVLTAIGCSRAAPAACLFSTVPIFFALLINSLFFASSSSTQRNYLSDLFINWLYLCSPFHAYAYKITQVSRCVLECGRDPVRTWNYEYRHELEFLRLPLRYIHDSTGLDIASHTWHALHRSFPTALSRYKR